MATTADSPSSPTVPGGGGGESNSPQFRRKNLSSPWSRVVRGESETLLAAHQSSSSSTTFQVEQTTFADCPPPKTASPSPPPENASSGEGSDANSGNAARPKKLAWNKPSNGVVEVGPVMGAVSWPALSESTKASPKSSADSASKTVADASVSSSQGPVTPHSPQKQATTNANPSSTTNHTMLARPRSMKRGGGGNTRGGPAQSGFTHPPPPPPPPPFPVFQLPPNRYPNMVQAVPDPSHREFPYRGNNWETRPAGGFSQSHSVNDHRNSSRRGNFGPHQRGDGSYHNNHGGRRDQDRGNYGNARDLHLHRGSMRGFVRPPPPNTGGFVTPPPVRPFMNHMGYPEFYYIPPVPMETFRPFIAHPPPPTMFIPVAEPPLPTLLINQIDYYFSDANLVKDDYLRSNMDDQGWVPITLIASFPRVKNLTSNIQLILDSLRSSTIVEVQDNKVRRRNEWKKWIPVSALLPSDSGSVSPNKSGNDMSETFQKITIEEIDTKQSGVTGKADPNSEAVEGRFLTESIGHSQLSNGEVTENTCPSQN